MESEKSDYFINHKLNPELILSSEEYKEFQERTSLSIHRNLPNYQPTPLITDTSIASKLGISTIFIKDESHRFGIKAFKGLGASFALFSKIGNLSAEEKSQMTVCTASDGNHGKAVAWGSKILGVKCVIYLPKCTVEARVENIKKEGAEVVVFEGTYDETVQEIFRISGEKGWLFVQDTALPGYHEIPKLIMQGYNTMKYEMEEILHKGNDAGVDVVIMQAGVGTWAAVGAYYYHHHYSQKCPFIVIIEPLEADCCLESMKQGKLATSKKSYKTIMAGLNCGTPSIIAYEILKEMAHVFIAIPDSYAKDAMKMFKDIGIISGETGASGLAALIAISQDPSLKEVKEYLKLGTDSKVLIFNTEGDTDPVSYKNIVGLE